MTDLPPNVIRFPRPYRQPPARRTARVRFDRMGRPFEPYPSREERIHELVEVVLNWRG